MNEKFKKLMNKKIILGVLAIIVAMVFIGITSFIPFIITKDKLQTEEFWTDEIIIIAITIFAMVATMFVGQASNAQNDKSELAKAKVSFKESIVAITNYNFFFQWVKKILQPRDIQYVKERELRKIGIDDYSILQLEDEQIKKLAVGAQKFGDKYYSQITQKQVDIILDLKDGVKRMHLVEPGYYLTISSIDSDKTISEKSGREQFKKTLKLLVSITSKIVLALIPTLIFAALARDLTEGAGGDKAEAWARFLSRLFALVSSAFIGYIVGCQMNDIDADYINLKIIVHNQYIQDTEFTPLSEQELAKEQYYKRLGKKPPEEEAKKE